MHGHRRFTGASSGIGRAAARELRRAGHTVYGAARRVGRMDDIRAAGGHALETDARIEEDLDRVVATVLDDQQRTDVLVNNAGTVLHGAVEDVPLDRARDQLEVNLSAPARLTQLVLPHMREQRSGTIVNVSSIDGEIALPLGAWYYASKHALEALSDTLRMEAARFGVGVVITQPGIIKTEFEDRTTAQLREMSGRDAYREMAEAMARRGKTGLSEGANPGVVAETIRQVVESDHPDTRYAVGWLDEELLRLNRSLRDREFDEMATRSVGWGHL
ncbi:oxidoreductase [Streptomyces celluloflavus]|uniref:oxidoreductase n=1 Tax=Streptomyces celluloflavus TaxID=58344 RepID=UPI0036681507